MYWILPVDTAEEKKTLTEPAPDMSMKSVSPSRDGLRVDKKHGLLDVLML
jgi:hypothetical protein